MQSSIQLVQRVFPAAICRCAELFRLLHVQSMRPLATQLLRPRGYGERTQGAQRAPCRVGGGGVGWGEWWLREREKEKEQEHDSLVPWDYITLHLEETRSFSQMTNKLPRLSRAWDGVTSLPITSFPRLGRQASLVKCCALCLEPGRGRAEC